MNINRGSGPGEFKKRCGLSGKPMDYVAANYATCHDIALLKYCRAKRQKLSVAA
jgi:hypothetical protein